MYKRIKKSVIYPFSIVIIERRFVFAGNILINGFLIFKVYVNNMIIDITSPFDFFKLWKYLKR